MIPNEFHFVFGLKKQTEPFHLIHYLCLESCLQVNQPDAVRFYYHYEPFGEYWDLIKPKVVLERVELAPFVSRFKYQDRAIKKYRYAHQSDFIRLAKLIERGGVYADIDTIFVRRIPAFLFDQPAVLGREPDIIDPNTGQTSPSVCNAFIMAEQGSEFCSRWLDGMEASFDGTWSNHSTLLPMRLSREFPELIHLEPIHSFYQHPPNRDGIAALFLSCDRDYDGILSMHLWAHLWWSERRVDISAFHASLVTEEYVRNVDTTYNLIARKYLPSRPLPTAKTAAGFRPAETALAQPAGSQRTSIRRNDLKAYLWVLLKIAGFKILPDWAYPNAAGHLDYAKRQRLYHLIKRRIRARNPVDEDILAFVSVWDEYRITAERFAPGDTILDVGAHIGAFSYLCYLLGSRDIHAYEPESANYAHLEANLRGLKGIHFEKRAVFRSDRRSGCTISLDQILSAFDRVKLLKLDCEGSEFPILMTCKSLQKVDAIVGEYHEVNEESLEFGESAARIEGQPTFLAQTLADRLAEEGFSVRLKPASPQIGKFFAHRS